MYGEGRENESGLLKLVFQAKISVQHCYEYANYPTSTL